MKFKFSKDKCILTYKIFADDEDFFRNFDRIKEEFKEAKVIGISELIEGELVTRFSALYDWNLFAEIEKRYNVKLEVLEELKPLEIKIIE